MVGNDIEYVVIGAGVIGLAIARELALQRKEVLVLEKNSRIGDETSFRNSAVIHAGIYYPDKSLKAKFCREGQARLYAYCENKKIPHRKIGKLIVATSEAQKIKLAALLANATANNVELQSISQHELQDLEPNLFALAGIYSPSTGIIDGGALLKQLQVDFITAGGEVVCERRVKQISICDAGFNLCTEDPEKPAINCKYVINAAGLWAETVAKNIQGLCAETIPPQYYAKGHYFKLRATKPFSHLIYPLPEKAGLGIHATIDMHGEVRFGPDVEWVAQLDYTHTPGIEEKFYRAIREYYPALPESALLPDFVGIRPKISPPQNQPQDFIIQSQQQHRIKNLINLYGIESPGLTASLAIAAYVKDLLV